MKLTLYQPQVSASVLSQPGGGRRPFESPVAAGLGRLGSAVDALEKRRQTGRDAALAADALARFRKDETAALRRQAKDPEALGDGFAERALRDFEIRRDKTIAALKEQSQAAADRFAEGAAAVAETVRAGVLAAEASAAGGAIAGQVSAALGAGMETLREDPDQYAAILGELDGTIDVLAGDGFPAEAADRLRRQSGAKLSAAAIEGMIAEDPAAALAALDEGAFAETLEPTARERWTGRARRARDREAAATEAVTAASQAGLWREFERFAESWRRGEESAAGAFDDDVIRAALPAGQADKMILLRDRAEAEGAAFLRVALTPPDKVAALIAAAGPEEAALLRGAAAERDRLLTDNPAGFARRNPLVADAHAAWQAAEASGDAAAAEAAAQTYAEASLAEQRRLGLPATERRLLTPAGATALLAEFNATDRPDPAALGDRLRGWFGDRWVGVLQQLEEVGLPASLAEIAAMDRADQRAARRRLADLIGTPTAELRTAIGEDVAGVVDQRLRNALVARTRRGLPTFGGPTDAGMENVRRLSYALVDSGEAPRAAADEAATRVWKEVEGVPELIHVRDDFGLRFVGPGVGPYTGEKAREIEELLGAITSAAEDDLDEMIERINLVFGDMPEFAAVVAGYTRLALGAVGRPSMPRENAREALGLFRDLMLTDQIPGGWDYREFPQQGRLAAFESSMRDLVASYQHDYPLAAEYLERFLDGTGGTVELEVDYLRSQPDMAPGEERNRRRFKEWFLGQLDTIDPSEAIHEELNAMSDGDTLTRGTPWVTVISASLSDLEYYLAIRGSNLESNGDFVFNRVGDTILVEGTVVHVWTDEYDWTAGESVRLPSSDDPLRVVSQDDMLALRDFGGAADFHVRPTENWEQDVTGTLTVRDGKVVEADLTWGEMRLVPRSGMANQSP